LSNKANEVSEELSKRVAASTASPPATRASNREERVQQVIRLVSERSTAEIRKIQAAVGGDKENANYILSNRVEKRKNELSNLGYPEQAAKERALFEALGIDKDHAIENWPQLSELDEFAEHTGRSDLSDENLASLQEQLAAEEKEMIEKGYRPIYEVHDKYEMKSSDLWASAKYTKLWIDELRKAGLISVDNFLGNTDMWALTSEGQDYFWYGTMDVSGDKYLSERALYVQPGKLSDARRRLGISAN
jgi:hypothetical protein